jgi:hypothetical protein
MLYEYAVEPKAIGSTWDTFRYVIEKFGFDKGRIIAEFPRRAWFSEVYEAARAFSPTQRTRLEILLNKAKGTKVVRTGRPYNREAGDWLYNALMENRRIPFTAIIASENVGADSNVLTTHEMNEQHPLMIVANNRAVPRDAVSIASALAGFLEHGSRILFVDPFFNPFSPRYKSSLTECLRITKSKNPTAACEIHYRYHENNMLPSDIARSAANAFLGVIPEGMSVKIYCWRQRDGGADFHARYLLTDKGGIGVDAGFSAEGNHETTDMHILDLTFCADKLVAFSGSADVFDLIGPILLIDAQARVSEL